MAGMDSELEKGLHAIVDSFYKYAKGPPGKKQLDEKAFQELLKNELSHQLTNVDCKKSAKALQEMLDVDKNKQVSFDEYWALITHMCQAISCSRDSH